MKRRDAPARDGTNRSAANRGATYHVCPTCARSVHASAAEHYCPNDGTKLLIACPACGTSIRTPYARFCTHCGEALTQRTP